MKCNQKGIELIKKFEGCHLKAYKCPAGILTIGYGHTKQVTENMEITEEVAEDLLIKDVEKWEKYVEEYMKDYKLNINQFSALVSFCFNLGSKLNQLTANKTRSIEVIADKMLLYCKAKVDGKMTTLKGLQNRRIAERELFMKVAYTQPVIQTVQQYTHEEDKSFDYITTTACHIRSGAGISTPSVGIVNANVLVDYSGKYIMNGTTKWCLCYIHEKDIVGYISEKLLKKAKAWD